MGWCQGDGGGVKEGEKEVLLPDFHFQEVEHEK
jgi:hypothetical protein